MELVEIHRRLAREVGAEWAAHHRNLCRRDSRLIAPSELTEFLQTEILRATESGDFAFGLRDGSGWRALAIGSYWFLRQDDPAQEIVFRRNMTWNVLLLRPWEHLDARELFTMVNQRSAAEGAEMIYVSVPTCDIESAAFVARHGFEPAFAHCCGETPLGEPPPPPQGITIHRAARGDGAKVVDCHVEELDYHGETAPTQKTSYPGRRQRQLRGCEDLIRDANGISMYASSGAEVIAVADGRVGHTHLRPSLMLPEATIGFIRSVGTRAEWRGRGVGRALSLALAWEMEKRGATRLELVYCPWNPLSSRFWPHLGFAPATHGFCRRPTA
jgi:GNAT superfamily N-acetyltransferase